MIKGFDGLSFQFGFEEIKQSYLAVRQALAAQKDSAERVMRVRFNIPQSAPIPTEPFSEGRSFDDVFWELVGDHRSTSLLADYAIRDAFVVALFHFWERSANQWAGRERYQAKATFAVLRAAGIEPDEKQLEHLRLAANCIKHGKGGPNSACVRLCQMKPDFFAGGADNTDPSNDDLRLLEDDISDFFDAVFHSGPRGRGPWPKIAKC